MGGASHRNEGGNSWGNTSHSFDMFWEAEAAEALHSIQNISPGFVCMHINQLQWFWLCLKGNIVNVCQHVCDCNCIICIINTSFITCLFLNVFTSITTNWIFLIMTLDFQLSLFNLLWLSSWFSVWSPGLWQRIKVSIYKKRKTKCT